MKVKFSRCNSNSLANVPQVDGQLIYVKDTSEVYMDVGNNRNKLSDVIEVADITNVQNPIISKIYYDEATENLYKYIDTEWKRLGGSDTPQIYFWNGNQQTGLTFWNNIMSKNEDTDLIVLYKLSDYNLSTIIKIPQGSIKANKKTEWFDFTNITNSTSYSIYQALKAYVQFTILNDEITNYSIQVSTVETVNFLATDKKYQTPYTPQYAGSPATKKYVDDSISTYTPTSTSTTFDNTETGLQATNVQDAIEELVQKINDLETTVGQVDAILDEINGEII